MFYFGKALRVGGRSYFLRSRWLIFFQKCGKVVLILPNEMYFCIAERSNGGVAELV